MDIYEIEALATEFIGELEKTSGVREGLHRFGELLRGGASTVNVATGKHRNKKDNRIMRRVGNVLSSFKKDSPDRKEALKSLAARAGVGTAAVGTAGSIAAAASDKHSSIDPEILAQEYLEKVAISPELAGKASGMRIDREMGKAGIDSKSRFPTSIGQAKKQFKFSKDYFGSKKGQLHLRRQVAEQSKGNMAKYVGGYAKGLKETPLGTAALKGFGRLSDAISPRLMRR